jgi:mannose/fructose/N-acetylgalactosamine-specific phosphotransferase system component IID
MNAKNALALLWSGMKLNLLQACWNFERLQNVGFTAAIYNMLSIIYANDRENMKRAVKRHMGFFNTHIFFSSAVLGVMARLEEELPNAKPEEKERDIENTKMGIMGPLAAIGDSLFWSGIKPFALLVGTGAVLLSGYTVASWVQAIVLAMLVYNVPRFVVRYYLLFKAYFDYRELFVFIQKVKFQDIMKSIKIIGMGLLGGIMAGYFHLKDLTMIKGRLVDSLLLMGIFVLMVRAVRRKVSVSYIFASVVVISVIVSYILN